MMKAYNSFNQNKLRLSNTSHNLQNKQIYNKTSKNLAGETTKTINNTFLN